MTTANAVATANAVVMREMGWCPVWAGWVRRAAGLWNRVVQRDATDLVRLAVKDSCSMATEGVRGCWAAEFSRSVQRIADGLGTDWAVDLENLAELPADIVRGGAEEWWRLCLGTGARLLIDGEPAAVRQVPEQQSEGFKVLVHHRWFGVDWGDVVVKHTRFWQVLCDQRAVRMIARLRMGSHHLAVETGRWERPRKVPRAQRVCLLCNVGAVEDEMHFLFECQGLEGVRGRHLGVFGQAVGVSGMSDAAMGTCMNPEFEDVNEARAFWPKFCSALAECWFVRDSALAQPS